MPGTQRGNREAFEQTTCEAYADGFPSLMREEFDRFGAVTLGVPGTPSPRDKAEDKRDDGDDWDRALATPKRVAAGPNEERAARARRMLAAIEKGDEKKRDDEKDLDPNQARALARAFPGDTTKAAYDAQIRAFRA